MFDVPSECTQGRTQSFQCSAEGAYGFGPCLGELFGSILYGALSEYVEQGACHHLRDLAMHREILKQGAR
jgi:hypothetical protein